MPSKTILTMSNNQEIQPVGEIVLDTKNPVSRTVTKLNYLVLEGDVKPVLGCSSLLVLNLVSVNYDSFPSRICYGFKDTSQHDSSLRNGALESISYL